MDLKQANIHLSNAEHSIRYFFMMDEELEIVCDLLQQATTAGTLGKARALTRVAGIALSGVLCDGDERTIALKHIEDALAEFQYQDIRVVPGLPANARLDEHALSTGEIPRAGG